MFVQPEKAAVDILRRKGWLLYHTPWHIRGQSDLEQVIKNGPTPILRRYELYSVFPATDNEKDPETVCRAMEECLVKGRLPFFVRLRPVVVDGQEKQVPLWVMPIEQIGIGNDDEFVILADLNITYQYVSLLNLPDPIEASNGEVSFEAFSLTYYCFVEELENVTCQHGPARLCTREELEEWQEVTAWASFGGVLC